MFKVNFRKMGDIATSIVFKGTMEECHAFVAKQYPDFKESIQNGIPYFFKVHGRGLKGEACIVKAEV